MDTVELLALLIGLLFFLVLLVLFYVLRSRPKTITTEESILPLTLDQLEAMLYSPVTTNHQLNHAANEILKRFMAIDHMKRYKGFIEAISLHPNTDSALISSFEKRLRDGNPKHKEDIRKALKEGLAKRDKK